VFNVDLFSEAVRQLEICNACRYCEGYCAVFPALERPATLTRGRVEYLANLCHDCRACYYACPFAEPHEFAVNIPLLMTDVRQGTYRRYAWPRAFADAFQGALGFALRWIAFGLVVALGVVLALHGPAGLFRAHTGPGAFYAVIPWLALVGPALLLTAYAAAVFGVGAVRFWRTTAVGSVKAAGPRALLSAAVDVLRLRWLEGGGDGCYFPGSRPSRLRSTLHALVFYGLGFCFVSTTVAAIQQDAFGSLPPYPLLSIPVVTGTLGGVAIVIGCGGLMLSGAQADEAPSRPERAALDLAFLLVLGAASLSGLFTLALRDTALLGLMLGVHVGVLGALYVTAPYGKLVHAVYRTLAIVRNRVEQRTPGGSPVS
jgi:citrate/tricarballylate utilization protein